MSTVKQHLGLLLRLRQLQLQTGLQFSTQATLLCVTHLDELILLAGGAELEEFARLSLGDLNPAPEKS